MTPAAARRRAERDAVAGNTFVLDMFKPAIGGVATTDEVCRLLRVGYRPNLCNVLNRHGDELVSDGWDRAAGTFTRRAVIRMAMLLRPSTSARAARIAKAARAGIRLLSFDHPAREQQCASVLNRAFALAEDVRDDDPGEVWAGLRKLDRHVLAGVAVTLAAMVDIDAPGATRYLRELAGGDAAPVDGVRRLVPPHTT